jgi:hypothetical protein
MKNNNDKVFNLQKKLKDMALSKKTYQIKKLKKKNYKKSGSYVKPKIIRNWSEYFSFIQNVESSYINPVFYRGQTNANYLLIPSSLRKNPKNKHNTLFILIWTILQMKLMKI